jgi:hypothetical protein
MRRIFALVLGGALAVGFAAPAGAIETTDFGIEAEAPVADAQGRPRLVADVAAGRTTETAVRVWNNSLRPVTVELAVVPATVDPDGWASLEGDAEPVGWISLAEERVHLAPGEERAVDLVTEGPRRLDGRPRTAAVLAQLAGDGDGAEAPAVVQRLALVTYLRPVAGGPPGLGILPWVAGALALAVAGWAASSRSRGGRAAPALSHT